MKPVYIGTSGWSYKVWEKAFYPPEIPKSRQFEYYLTQFPTVEINLTFYRLPTLKMTQSWHDIAPRQFLYSIKGSRFITHMKKLSNLDGAMDRFFERLKPLKNRMGPVLWQLPAVMKKDVARLGDFLKRLPSDYRHAVEFRNPSWLGDEVFALLRKHRIAHVSISSGAMPMNRTVTTDFIYIRFHGLEGGSAHDYTSDELKPWARHICRHADKTVFAYFNNEVDARAPKNARELMEMVGSRAVMAFTR